MCKSDIEDVYDNNVDDDGDSDVYNGGDGDINHVNLDDEHPNNLLPSCSMTSETTTNTKTFSGFQTNEPKKKILFSFSSLDEI